MHYLFTNIKYLLIEKGIEEEEFYSNLGFSQSDIFNLVTGNNNPSPEQLIKIAESLDHNIDTLIRKDLKKIKDSVKGTIKMVVVDVDGVLTDAGMYFSDTGFEIKKFNAKDGLAMGRLVKNGIPVGMLSHGYNKPLIKKRAEMLGIPYIYAGQDKKLTILKEWSEKSGIPLESMAYIGDDINDMDVILSVGFSAAPSDAAEDVKAVVDYVLTKEGGKGCVREFAEDFLKDKIS